MSEDIKVNITLGTGFANGVHKTTESISRAYWESMSEEARETFLNEIATEWMWSKLDLFWEVEE